MSKFRTLWLGLALALAAASLAQAAGLRLATGEEFYPVGLQMRHLGELETLGAGIKEAGFNCVWSAGPKGAVVLPAMWQAEALGLRVLQYSPGLGDPAGDEGGAGERVRLYEEAAHWARGNPANLGWLWEPLGWQGVKPERIDAFLLAVKAAAPESLAMLSVCLQQPRAEIARQARYADAVAVWLYPGPVDEAPSDALLGQIRMVQEALGPGKPIVLVLPGQEKTPGLLKAEALRGLALTGQTPGIAGVLFAAPGNEAIAQMQRQAAGALAEALGLPRPAPPAGPSRREEALAPEAGRSLLCTLRSFGEVSALNAMEEYRTPDASVGYKVLGRGAFLSLPIPNRSALVEASRLTRFAMRMFSTTAGQGALLMLSTTGEVAFTRVVVKQGWNVYEVDLATAKWEAKTPEASKWGGTTGRVQGLTFTPPQVTGAQIAWDWLRLEPPSTGEVRWELDKASELAQVEGLEGQNLKDGEMLGKCTGNRVMIELALPTAETAVGALPFLSWRANAPVEGAGMVEYWWRRGAVEEYGGRTSFRVQAGLQMYCLDLVRRGFAEGNIAGESEWGGPERKITRLHLTLPGQAGQQFALDWIRLGPNYDLRVAPDDLLTGEVELPVDEGTR